MKHISGFNAGTNSKERYYWAQDPDKEPPSFPWTRSNKDIWDNIDIEDQNKLSFYINRLNQTGDRNRGEKQNRTDEVNLSDKIQSTKDLVIELADKDVTRTFDFGIGTYWSSPKALKLINISKSDSGIFRLASRDKLLSQAAFDDGILISVVNIWKNCQK